MTTRWVAWQKRADQRREPWIDPEESSPDRELPRLPRRVSRIERPPVKHGGPGDEHAEPSNLAVTTDLPPVGWTDPDLKRKRRK